MHEM